jgi:hypothetical protein
VLRFGNQMLRESARLDLPAGRAPPQGALLSVIAEIERPRPEENGFDEAGYLRRQGVHVILTASSFQIVGHRGGLGGIADRIRAAIASSLAPGVGGERRAVIAAVVLGEDEGLSPELRDRFRASGLYHLLAESRRGITARQGPPSESRGWRPCARPATTENDKQRPKGCARSGLADFGANWVCQRELRLSARARAKLSVVTSATSAWNPAQDASFWGLAHVSVGSPRVKARREKTSTPVALGG